MLGRIARNARAFMPPTSRDTQYRIPYPHTWSFDHWRHAVWVENTGVHSTLFLGNCLT